MPEDNQPNDSIIANEATLPKVSFIKKHKLVAIIAAAIILVLIVLAVFLPVISLGNLKVVNLGANVRLEKGQTIQLKSGDASVKIINLADITCPQDVTCFGSGQVVAYEITVDGKKYATTNSQKIVGSKYQIETVNSDYKTYANIKITKTN